jgi:hypothetical protein
MPLKYGRYGLRRDLGLLEAGASADAYCGQPLSAYVGVYRRDYYFQIEATCAGRECFPSAGTGRIVPSGAFYRPEHRTER